MDIAAIAALAPVVPVLTVERPADAVPLARALVKGGLPVLEIDAFGPCAALEALRAMRGRGAGTPSSGAGTVLDAGQLEQARRAGARFAGQPGLHPALVQAAQDGRPAVPARRPDGVGGYGARPSRASGCLKFFPAEDGAEALAG